MAMQALSTFVIFHVIYEDYLQTVFPTRAHAVQDIQTEGQTSPLHVLVDLSQRLVTFLTLLSLFPCSFSVAIDDCVKLQMESQRSSHGLSHQLSIKHCQNILEYYRTIIVTSQTTLTLFLLLSVFISFFLSFFLF